MQADPTQHLSPHVLRALGAGRLHAAAAPDVLAHLDGCAECRQAGTALLGDSFLLQLRAAHPLAGTVIESPAQAETVGPSLDRAPTTPSAPPAVLPELRDHPQYEVLRELGRGGMGVVYLARNKLMDRPEVLKVVNPQLLGQAGAAARFLREIRSAARLNHPNIVAAHAALPAGGLLAFAMEYIEGQTLAQFVQVHGRLPVVNACSYTSQVALGLQHAFEKGMVHRDIKPQNLILASEGKKHVVKILDFGLAKATREGEEADRGLTGTGWMLGTPDYIAPEQTLDAAKADIRADIYSLGCTLYYLLTGSPPFTGNSQFELLQAHHAKEATPLNQLRNDVPAELAAVVAKMMAKDPGRRYQQPVEVAQALAPFVTSDLKPLPPAASAVAGTVIETISAWATKRAAKLSKKWLLVAGAGMAGLLLIVLVIVLATRPGPGSAPRGEQAKQAKPSPTIAKRVTRENFNKLGVGISVNRVGEILGAPGKVPEVAEVAEAFGTGPEELSRKVAWITARRQGDKVYYWKEGDNIILTWWLPAVAFCYSSISPDRGRVSEQRGCPDSTSTVSRANFDKLRVGMTPDQVEAVLGKGPESSLLSGDFDGILNAIMPGEEKEKAAWRKARVEGMVMGWTDSCGTRILVAYTGRFFERRHNALIFYYSWTGLVPSDRLSAKKGYLTGDGGP